MKRRMSLVSKALIGVGSLLGVGGLVLAGTRLLRTRELRSLLDLGDRRFLKAAAQDGIEEVEMGHLAQQRGTDEAVRSFGQRLIQDHSKANSELRALAFRKGFVPPGYTKPRQRAMLEKLAGVPQARFPRKFAACMIDMHERAIALFQAAERTGNDPEVREFAGRTLPVLQEHLRLAQELRDRARSQQTAESGPVQDQQPGMLG